MSPGLLHQLRGEALRDRRDDQLRDALGSTHGNTMAERRTCLMTV
jgi:hypothetical protein